MFEDFVVQYNSSVGFDTGSIDLRRVTKPVARGGVRVLRFYPPYEHLELVEHEQLTAQKTKQLMCAIEDFRNLGLL